MPCLYAASEARSIDCVGEEFSASLCDDLTAGYTVC
jgi:hypothetical protein